MPETSMVDQIKKLIDLQKIDSEIYEIGLTLEEKPAIIAELKDQFESSKAHLKELEDNRMGVLAKRKEYELDLQTKEDEITKANAQLSQIKTNKEYTAKITEIESIKADQSIFEEKILLSYDESDVVNTKVEKEKSQVDAAEKLFTEKKNEVDEEVKELKDRIKVLEGQRQELLPGIDKSYLNSYEKILKHKQGRAIVPVLGNSCSGCNMNVTHQQINQIKMHDELVSCEMCLRILYIEGDL